MSAGIYPHGDGKWRIFVYVGTDPATGKQRQVTRVVAGTKKDAELARARLLVEVGGGQHATNGDHTFGQALDAYIAHKALSVAATTHDTNRWQLGYIPDHLKAMPLAKLGVEHIEALYLHLATKGKVRSKGGLSPSAMINVHKVVHGALELARRRKWIAVNPAADAEVPTGPRRQPSPAPADAIARLFDAARLEHPALPTYLRVTLCAGGRRSEIHGLRWNRIDFTRGFATLSETIVRADGAWLVKPHTKTGRPRTVVLDAGTLDQLGVLHAKAMEYAMACGVALPPTAFVFTDQPVGETPWNPRTTAQRWKRACVRAGVDPATRLHDLRHLMATHLLDQGVPIPVVSARLGHALNSTTLDIYGGRVAASDAHAAEVMGRLLDGG
jgi:integrase